MSNLQNNFNEKLDCTLATCFGGLLLLGFIMVLVLFRFVLFCLTCLFFKANFLPAHYIKRQAQRLCEKRNCLSIHFISVCKTLPACRGPKANFQSTSNSQTCLPSFPFLRNWPNIMLKDQALSLTQGPNVCCRPSFHTQQVPFYTNCLSDAFSFHLADSQPELMSIYALTFQLV